MPGLHEEAEKTVKKIASSQAPASQLSLFEVYYLTATQELVSFQHEKN